MDLFERLRRLRRRICIFSFWGSFSLIAFVVFLILNRSHIIFGIHAALCFLLVLLFIFLIAVTVSTYKKQCKDNLLKVLLDDSFSAVTYRAKEGFEKKTVENTAMIMMGNTFESSNFVSGFRNGVLFEMADVAIRQVTPYGKETNTVTFFDGSWMIFHFEKSFGTNLQVKEKSFSNAQFVPKDEKRLSFFPMDNKEFNRFFRVYGDDEARARYILSPRMLEAIQQVNYRLPGDLMLSFRDHSLHVAIHGTKRQWDQMIPTRPDRRKLQREVLLDVSVITEFVDWLLEDDTLFITEAKTPKSLPWVMPNGTF